MDDTARATIQACAAASAAGSISFGEVVARLAAAGIERYQVDYVRGEAVYYLAEGVPAVLPLHSTENPARAFSAAGVAAAVQGAQAGRLAYPAFSAAAVAAGCVGYLVSLAGRRVVYFGRTGECHVEHFPAPA